MTNTTTAYGSSNMNIQINGATAVDILVDGVRLEAAWYGPAADQAPTLVFLHEGLGCLALWRDFPYRLAEATGCSAFIYSRQGYGKSDPARLPRTVNFMHHEALKVLPGVLLAAGIKRAVLIGHSDGGSIALIYAGSGIPGIELLGVVVEAAHVFCEAVTISSIIKAKQDFENGDLRQRLARYHGQNTDGAFYSWNTPWLDPDFLHWNIESYLPAVTAPVLAIQGENDPYGTLAQVEAIVRNVGARAESLILPDCGHSPHWQQPAATLEAMTRFIFDLTRD